MNLQPRTIGGALHPHNSGAVDVGSHGLAACGVQEGVVVVDPRTLQTVQMLLHHRASVTRVRWARDDLLPHHLRAPYALRLASADAAGLIVAWKVAEAKPYAELKDSNGPVLDIQWHGFDYLVALHAPHNGLVLWDVKLGQKMWRMDMPNSIALSLDPFDLTKLVTLSNDSAIVLVDDITPTETPTNSRKYMITSSAQRQSAANISIDSAASSRSSTSSILRRNKPVSGSLTTTEADLVFSSIQMSDCLQMCHSPSEPQILFLLFTREILVLDLSIHQSIGSIQLERGQSPFASFCVTRMRKPQMIYCLHENGSLTARQRKNSRDVAYTLAAFADLLRLGKGVRVMTLKLDPIHENLLFGICSDGRFLTWEFTARPEPAKFSLIGYSENAFTNHTCMSVGPQVSPRNFAAYRPMIAVGNDEGIVRILHAGTCEVLQALKVLSTPILGIQWLDLDDILVYGVEEVTAPTAGSRNHVVLVSLLTGIVKPFRVRPTESYKLRTARLSSLCQYVILVFEAMALELWDVRTGNLVRDMPAFTHVTAIEWSPLNSTKHKRSQQREIASASGDNIALSYTKEHFVFTIADGTLFHFSVDGNAVVPGIQGISPDPGMSQISAMGWKDDTLITGDVTGMLHIWDLKARSSQTRQTGRGSVQRIRYSPGRGNSLFLVMFSDGVELWDSSTSNRVSQLKYGGPKQPYGELLHAVTEIGWLTAERPIVVTSTGCLRIYDRIMKRCASPVSSYEWREPVLCPHLMHPQSALYMKTLMQHQPWTRYSLDPESLEVPANDPVLDRVRKSLRRLPETVVEELNACDSIAQRCRLTAIYFGDEREITMWQLIRERLQDYTRNNGKRTVGAPVANAVDLSGCFVDLSKRVATSDVSNANLDAAGTAFAEAPPLKSSESLPPHFNLLRPSNVVYSDARQRLAMHADRRGNNMNLSQQIAFEHVCMGQGDMATKILMETPPGHANYYSDMLRACLIAHTQGADSFQSTIKLAATSLIASGSIDSGIELLCVIGKQLDACRYLQSAGQWRRAAFLARCTLDDAGCSDIFSEWAEHLFRTGHRQDACLLLLSMSKFEDTLSHLTSSGEHDTACLLLEACDEAHVSLTITQEKRDEIFFEYGRYLKDLGLSAGVQYYAELAHERGVSLTDVSKPYLKSAKESKA